MLLGRMPRAVVRPPLDQARRARDRAPAPGDRRGPARRRGRARPRRLTRTRTRRGYARRRLPWRPKRDTIRPGRPVAQPTTTTAQAVRSGRAHHGTSGSFWSPRPRPWPSLPASGARSAQDVREFSFGYDQPKTTGYGFAGDLFEAELGELSGGSMKINQFPGAQLGQEPVMLQKVRSGDIDFIITSSANGATVSPELGVMSLHFLFEDEDHLAKAVASPELNDAIKQLVEDTVEGAHVLTADDARLPQHLLQGGGPRASTTSRARRSASRRPRPRTRTSPPTAPSRCTCRSARSTPRSRPAWSTWPRTASTSTSRTSTTRWRR